MKSDWNEIISEFNDLSVINWREQSMQMGLLRLCNMPENSSLSSTLIDMEVAYRDAQYPDKIWPEIKRSTSDCSMGLRLVSDDSSDY